VEGTVEWAMNIVPYYQSFGEHFTFKQMTNAMARIKKVATFPPDLKSQPVEK
jgi:hypothetical protein